MKRWKLPFGRLLWFLCEIVAGVLMLIDPAGLTYRIFWAGGWLLLVLGAASIVGYFAAAPLEASRGQGLVRGLCALGVGLCCILRLEWLLGLFSSLAAAYAVVVLFLALLRFQWAVDVLRLKQRCWYLHGIWALLGLGFAYGVLWSGRLAGSAVWVALGVLLIAGAVADLVLLCLYRKK
ncbi:MAG: hypothetical protein LUE91_03965 [Oscillospiraceae bacterium]|nr:hypothetical protein [Oscillospiraceae bacterium]